MALRDVKLDDKYDLGQRRVFVTGFQALVRLCLMQKELDRRNGLNTAGFVTGYRGSPLGGLDSQFLRAAAVPDQRDVRFQGGINEDLAATAVWGTAAGRVARRRQIRRRVRHVVRQRPRRRPHRRRVPPRQFRRHRETRRRAGADGRRPHRRILDHRAPVRIPLHRRHGSDPQSRGRAGGARLRSLRLGDVALHRRLDRAQDACTRPSSRRRRSTPVSSGSISSRRTISACRKAGSISASTIRSWRRKPACTISSATPCSPSCAPTSSTAPSPRAAAMPKIGIITTGKSYLDVRQAFDELGIDEIKCNELGIRLYKVGCPWPLSRRELAEFAAGLDLIIVVEEKRSLIEVQVREELYGTANQPVCIGKTRRAGQLAVPGQGRARSQRSRDLHRRAAAEVPPQRRHRAARGAAEGLPAHRRGDAATSPSAFRISAPAARTTPRPWCRRACAPMPVSAAIIMAQWMDRSTLGYTQMGGEGANWVGEAPFSRRESRFPESRRRHLQPFRLHGDPRRDRRRTPTSPTRSCSTTPWR